MDDSLAFTAAPARTLRGKNIAASVAVVAIACAVYRYAPHNLEHVEALYRARGFAFTGAGFLVTASVLYAILLAIHFLTVRDPAVSKSLQCFRVIAAFLRSPRREWRRGLTRDDRVALLATLLKAFFGPMMAMLLMRFCMGALAHGASIAQSDAFDGGFRILFDRHGFWFLMQVILFIDVLIYTVGYLVELPSLHNEIRSVDPTLLGWAAALACYPPFNVVTGAILGSQSSDFPQFDSPTAHFILNIALLALMALFASASIALGFKASNLTHRGIVSRGPYALVRHPAYTSKNVAWWIGAIPSVSAAFASSVSDGVLAVASVVGVTMLYVVRAITEEDHLRSVDSEYASYAAKVRFRFIPGLI